MCKLLNILSILLAVVIVASNPIQSSEMVKVEFVTSDELKDVLKLYPDAIKVDPSMVKVAKNAAQPYKEIKYTFGKRASGDTMVAAGTQGRTFDSPQDAQSTIIYPSSGEGSLLTYVTLAVRQSTLNSSLWLLSGGPGSRHMKIMIETWKTTIFEHDVNYYGF